MAPSEKLMALASLFLEKLSTLDISEMLSIREPNCTQWIGPSSLERPILDNDGFSQAYGPMLVHFHSMKSEVVNMFTDCERNVIILHTRTQASTIGGPYDNEYVYFIHASTDGEKIVKIEEFVDSARAKAQGAKLKEAIMAKAQADAVA